jgi:small basic protein
MNVYVNVVIWGVVAGIALGVVLYYAIPDEFRPIVERACLRFGGVGVLFQIAALAITRGEVSAQVITAIGITVLTFLVAGVWLFSARKRRSGV